MSSELLDRARKLLEGTTDAPWEFGDRYHTQGASHCECLDGFGPLVWSGFRDINGERMKAHVHRRETPWWGHGILHYDGAGGIYTVVNDTDEYGYMSPPDARFIAAARTLVPELAAEVERLAAENAELRAKVERWIDANERDCRELTELRAKVERVLLSIDRPEEDERYAAEVNDGGALMVIQAERRIARDLRRALDGEQS